MIHMLILRFRAVNDVDFSRGSVHPFVLSARKDRQGAIRVRCDPGVDAASADAKFFKLQHWRASAGDLQPEGAPNGGLRDDVPGSYLAELILPPPDRYCVRRAWLRTAPDPQGPSAPWPTTRAGCRRRQYSRSRQVPSHRPATVALVR